MKKTYVSMFFAILLAVSMQAQDGNLHSTFRVPFDFPLYLSGNFGELRSNHFHGGVDFKTQGVEGKPIRCLADGYISRASISAGGYGNAIYITHDNGYTSVHGHLQAFMPELAKLLREHQYANEVFVVDTTFTPERFPIKRGEVVALAGNSGYSFGPHLHMEIRETATNEPVDPLLFYMNQIKDTRAPVATSVMLYPQRGKAVVAGESVKRAFSFGKSNLLSTPIEAWGMISAGISANDYMDGTHNKYGVCSVTLLVDGVEVSRSSVNRFLFSENRLINSWVDYDEYIRRGRWYMRSYIAPGNPLRMLHADERRGWVDICEARDYNFEYRLSDLYGNTSHYFFTVRGVPTELSSVSLPTEEYELAWNEAHVIQKPGFELVIPRGMLYEDSPLTVDVTSDSTASSFIYQLGKESVPLHDYCTLSIAPHHLPLVDTSKYYVAGIRGKWRGSMGGKYEDGWIKTRIRDLGASYYVAVDTIPPEVEPLNRNTWMKSGILSFRIKDTQTGISSYKGTINGRFVLFEYSSKNRRLTCRLKDTPYHNASSLNLRLLVTDGRGNETLYETRLK